MTDPLITALERLRDSADLDNPFLQPKTQAPDDPSSTAPPATPKGNPLLDALAGLNPAAPAVPPPIPSFGGGPQGAQAPSAEDVDAMNMNALENTIRDWFSE